MERRNTLQDIRPFESEIHSMVVHVTREVLDNEGLENISVFFKEDTSATHFRPKPILMYSGYIQYGVTMFRGILGIGRGPRRFYVFKGNLLYSYSRGSFHKLPIEVKFASIILEEIAHAYTKEHCPRRHQSHGKEFYYYFRVLWLKYWEYIANVLHLVLRNVK